MITVTDSPSTHFLTDLLHPGSLAIMDICGTFGGGTVTPGFKAADGSFSPFLQTDGSAIAITSRGGFQVRVPRSQILGVTVAGATSPSIIVDIIPAVNTNQ